jgi:hypothetical protein
MIEAELRENSSSDVRLWSASGPVKNAASWPDRNSPNIPIKTQ